MRRRDTAFKLCRLTDSHTISRRSVQLQYVRGTEEGTPVSEKNKIWAESGKVNKNAEELRVSWHVRCVVTVTLLGKSNGPLRRSQNQNETK